jgi:hypothetical protein
MRRVTPLLLIILFLTSCEKEDILIPEDKPEANKENEAPGTFGINVDLITDIEVSISWSQPIDPENDQITYEVAVNDSVCEYDITGNRQYTFRHLNPNTEYLFQVIALDPSRNQCMVAKTARTLNSFIKNIISFNPGYNSISFNTGRKTSDNGYVMTGTFRKNILDTDDKVFILKLDPDFNFEWFSEIDHIESPKGITDLSDGYLIVGYRVIIKVNSQGTEEWYYKQEDEFYEFTCKSVIENQDRSLTVAGLSWRDHINKKPEVDDEYMIVKLTHEGNEVSVKYGDTINRTDPFDMIQLSNGNYVIFGKATKESMPEPQECFWLLETDNNLNVIRQNMYPNDTQGDDLPSEIFKTVEGNYILTGTAEVDMLYVTYIPRIMKVNDKGVVIWDKTYDVKSPGGEFPFFGDMAITNDGSFIMATNDDRGGCLSYINNNGQGNWYVQLNGYPQCIMTGIVGTDDYFIFTRDGSLVIYNHDGYVVKQQL